MTEQGLRDAMNTHGHTVYRLALCRTQNTADAEDVYQDVFLRLLQQQAEDWEQERVKAWLIRATLNRCADLYRFRLRRPVLPLEAVAEIADIGNAETAVSPAQLWVAVTRLPEKLRTVIHLYYGEDCSTEEIASLLGVPPATVRTRLHRGREKLRKLLGGFEDEA